MAPSSYTVAIVEPLGSCEMKLEQGWYFPEFGVKQKAHVVVLSQSQVVPFSLSYQIRKPERLAL